MFLIYHGRLQTSCAALGGACTRSARGLCVRETVRAFVPLESRKLLPRGDCLKYVYKLVLLSLYFFGPVNIPLIRVHIIRTELTIQRVFFVDDGDRSENGANRSFDIVRLKSAISIFLGDLREKRRSRSISILKKKKRLILVLHASYIL